MHIQNKLYDSRCHLLSCMSPDEFLEGPQANLICFMGIILFSEFLEGPQANLICFIGIILFFEYVLIMFS
jgi:hypothetical protein